MNSSITPSFFISQSIKLHNLLNTITEESSNASDPESCIDYLQLSEILSALLEESQIYSLMSALELQQNSPQARLFVERVESIGLVIEGWKEGAVRPSSSDSRKRSRTPDDGDGDGDGGRQVLRRRVDADRGMNEMAVFGGPFAEMLPPSENANPWWMEPYYG